MSDLVRFVIEHAINSEIFFQKLYKESVERVDIEDSKKLLLILSKEEEGHRKKLEAINLGDIDVKSFSKKFGHANLEKKLTSSLILPKFNSIGEIVQYAIEAEAHACEFYKKLGESIDDKNIKELCDSLAEEEEKHEKILREHFA